MTFDDFDNHIIAQLNKLDYEPSGTLVQFKFHVGTDRAVRIIEEFKRRRERLEASRKASREAYVKKRREDKIRERINAKRREKRRLKDE